MLSKHFVELKPMLAEENPDSNEPGVERSTHIAPLLANTQRALLGVAVLLVALCGVVVLHSRTVLPKPQAHFSDIVMMDENEAVSNNGSLAKMENIDCKAGTAKNEKGECVTCHAGRFAPSRSTECSVCAAGRFAGPGSETCDKCETGHYSFREESKCKACPGDETPHNDDSGSQCNVELCGHTCDEVVLHIMTETADACSFSFKSGCPNESPPAPFNADSKLSEVCPFACEKRNDTVQEELDHRFINKNGPQNDAACRGEHENDNSVDYYVLHEEEGLTLKSCMQWCVKHSNCTGIEFQHSGVEKPVARCGPYPSMP